MLDIKNPGDAARLDTDVVDNVHTPKHRDVDRAALLSAIATNPTGAATAALQSTGNNTLSGILSTLKAQVDLSTTLWTDDSAAFYVRRDVVDQDTGTVTVSFTTPDGSAATPGAGLRPAANEEALATLESLYVATASGTGYSNGDLIARQVVINQNATPPTVVASTWVNLTTGAVVTPLSADITRTAAAPISAGENHIGKVGGNTVVSTDTPTVSVSPAYSTGDCIGGKLTFANMGRLAGGTGLIQMASVQCKSAQSFGIDLVLFHTDPVNSTFVDNAPVAVSAADFDKILGVVHITDWTNLGAVSFAEATQLAMAYKVASGSTGLFGVAVSRGAPTLASTSDVKVVLKSLLD